MKGKSSYFSAAEKLLWLISVLLVTVSFAVFDRADYLTLSASLIGVTSLIFAAKGNPVGPLLMILFSILYGVISFGFRYYGEMVTYLGMTMPMSVISLVAWLKNPFRGNRAEVTVNRISGREAAFAAVLTIAVTVIFRYVLERLGTANLIPSTLSVTTSFAAVYLTFRRSPYYAVAYAMNDIILIIMWSMAAASDRAYVSVTVCFAVFLFNDIYGFVNWRRLEKKQAEIINDKTD